MNELAQEMFAEFGFSTCSTTEKQQIIEEYREELYNEVIQDFDYLNGYCLTDDERHTIITDIVELIVDKLNTISNG
jgi:hypothetical protein